MIQRAILVSLLAGLATPARGGPRPRSDQLQQRDPHNTVERLQQRLDDGRAKLTCEKGPGYLRSLLRELNVPESSQMLVFSKTSLQRQRINPARRAPSTSATIPMSATAKKAICSK